MEEENKKEAYEFSIAGFKLKLNSTFIAMAIPIVTTIAGAMWGAFEFYKDYMDMKEKIQTYVAPDLAVFDKRLAVIEENSQKSADYTRDIKTDLKNDIRRLENVVENVERSAKQSQRETDQAVKEVRNELRDARRESEQSARQLQKEIDNKIQKALDNPLSK